MDWTFHPTLVAPFYGHLMRANITSYSLADRKPILEAFRVRAAEVSDEQIQSMLFSSWRPAKVAAWFIAYGKRGQFVTTLQAMLLEQPNYVEHLCIALARVNDASTQAALVAYVDGCATGQLQSSPLDESITPEWAVCTLEYLGAVEQAELSWNNFIASQQRHSSHVYTRIANSIMASWPKRLECARTAFLKSMELFDDELRT